MNGRDPGTQKRPPGPADPRGASDPEAHQILPSLARRGQDPPILDASGDPTRRKTSHDLLLLSEIIPSHVNDLIYRPVRWDDPEIQALAESIKTHGLQEPIVVTSDHVIISGHRRYAACALLKMSRVRCRVEPVTSADPRFEILLRECNRQRVKSFDEIVREQIIDINPNDAYAALSEHRAAASQVSGDFLTIEGVKFRKEISQAKQPMLRAIRKIVFDQKAYWPLSDRSIHYDLLNDPPLRHSGKPESRYQNNRSCYQDTCDLLTRARLTGKIPFAAIEDPTRTVATWNTYREVSGFVGKQLDGFLKNYWRDLQQSQPNHIEIVGEKNTVESSIRPVAMEFC